MGLYRSVDLYLEESLLDLLEETSFISSSGGGSFGDDTTFPKESMTTPVGNKMIPRNKQGVGMKVFGMEIVFVEL